ncbi:PHP domain-containing protein [Alkalibacter rhizosphaerae]|uniref:PHP domain-containing protein n=1 Tax=Alkalibacter rhizosphaerae TaxID=2815577 RepID=A0A974XDF8_9FIRM|nr:PHP domain-containing protein [Alkalibacter rhizosphaerae]QSX07812.1 PHP domain-containing protein [Alkalibacter rhizosphaerae]
MKITGDLHTHTTYSHGKGSMEDNVRQALELGLKKIAITDHGSGHLFYGVKKENWKRMRKEADDLQKKYPSIKIELGVEANIISTDGTIDVDKELFQLLDVVNVGYHYGVGVKKISDIFGFYILNLLAKGFPALRGKARRVNTKALLLAMDRYKIRMITHPGAKVPVDMAQIAQKAAKKKVLLEINAHHGHLTAKDVKIAMEYPVKFAINSDAHESRHVGMVEEGIKIAQEAGLDPKRIMNVEGDGTK